MRLLALGLLLLLVPCAAGATSTVELTPLKDNTLYESSSTFAPPSGGAIDGVFVGTAGNGLLRRALLAFDVAAAVPAGATILDASLTLSAASPRTQLPSEVAVFRVLSDWGEGTSTADFGSGGGGAGGAPTPGGSTWFHTFFPTQLWTNPGGDFAALRSSIATVPSSGAVTWTGLAADVQAQLDDPSGNFGWGLIEVSGVAAAHRLISREGGANGPRLSVSYLPEPGAGLLTALGLLALAGSGRERSRRRAR
jgi:hypothetical protein